MPTKREIWDEVKADAKLATREYFAPAARVLRWLRSRREEQAVAPEVFPQEPMKQPCVFFADQDSCQATDIMRCGYCGTHEGNACGKEGADRSTVTAYLFGNLNTGDIPLAQKLLAAGVKPYTVPTGTNQCDGCLQGAPKRGPIHLDKDGRASMYCEREKYAAGPPQGIL